MRINDTEGGTVQSDVKLLAVVNALQELGGAGVTELAEELELPISTVHKHLKTLETNYYVINREGRYRLGFRFLNHGGHVRASSTLCRHAKLKVKEIADEVDEMTMFSVKEYDFGVYTNIRNDKYGIVATNPLGSQFRLHETAGGKAILAELPDDEVERIIDRKGLPARTKNTITDRETLFENLERIRERGYSFDLEESTKGIQAIAAAIYAEEDDLFGALSIGGPANRLTRDKLENQFAEVVLGAINEIQIEKDIGQV